MAQSTSKVTSALITCVALGASILVSPTTAHAAWSGTNSKIIFRCKFYGSPKSDICSMNPDGSGLTKLTETESIDESAPAVSRDGRLIAFLRDQGELWVMNIDGSNVRKVSTPGVTADGPAFTPSGRISFRAQFTDRPFATAFEFVTVAISGGATTKIANAMGSYRAPIWTTNGAYVYGKSVPTTSDPRSYTEQLFIVKNGVERQVTSSGTTSGHSHSEISGNGSTAFFVRSTNSKSRVYKIASNASNGAGETPLTPSDENYYLPSPSPDGTKVVVQRNWFPNATDLAVVGVDGSGLTPITIAHNGTTGVYQASDPVWAPAPTTLPGVVASLTATAGSKSRYTKKFPVKLAARGASYKVSLASVVVAPKHKRNKKSVKKKTIKLAAQNITVHNGKTVTVNVALNSKAKSAVKSALSGKKKPTLTVTVTAQRTTGGSKSVIKTFKVALVR